MKRTITLTQEPAENGGIAFIAETDRAGYRVRGVAIATAREIDAAQDKSVVEMQNQMRALHALLWGMR